MYSLLRQRQVIDLQAHPRVVRQVIAPSQKEIASLAKSKITKLSSRIRNIWKQDYLRLSFTAWSHFTQLCKAKRVLAQQKSSPPRTEESEKVIIKQRLEVYDGTMEVWNTVRGQIVSWIENLYIRCNGYLDSNKK